MKKLNLILFLALFAFGCSENTESNDITVSAEVNGESWAAAEVATETNDRGELTYIEAKAADNSRIIFRMHEANLDVPSSNMPTDLDGNQFINELKIDAVPDLTQVDFTVKLSGIQPAVDFFVVERSNDGVTFEVLRSIEVGEAVSLSQDFSIENNRTSDNAFIFYRGKLIYADQSEWASEMAIGSTSFRGAYDEGVTNPQITGEFSLSSYSNGSISGYFSFDTNSSQIRKGLIEGLKF